MRSTIVPFDSTSSFASTSESELACSTVVGESDSRSSSVLVRLPLCANAKSPSSVRSSSGWALTTIDEPVVE